MACVVYFVLSVQCVCVCVRCVLSCVYGGDLCVVGSIGVCVYEGVWYV